MVQYDTYALKCYDVLKPHLEPHSDLELPQILLQRIAGFSLGKWMKGPPINLRYAEVLITVLAVGGRMGLRHVHYDYFFDNKIPATPLGLGAQWSYLTTELLQGMLRLKTKSCVLNDMYSTLINSIAFVQDAYALDLDKTLRLFKESTG